MRACWFDEVRRRPSPGRSWDPWRLSRSDTTTRSGFGGADRLLIDRVIPAIEVARGRTRQEVGAYMSHLKLAFTLGALHRNLYFKNGDYRLEAEYRFLEVHPVHLPTPDVKTRRRAGLEEDVLYRGSWIWRHCWPSRKPSPRRVIVDRRFATCSRRSSSRSTRWLSAGLPAGSVPGAPLGESLPQFQGALAGRTPSRRPAPGARMAQRLDFPVPAVWRRRRTPGELRRILSRTLAYRQMDQGFQSATAREPAAPWKAWNRRGTRPL